MKQRLVIIAGSVLFGLTVAVVTLLVVFKGEEHTIIIKKEQIQTAVDAVLPYEKKAFVFKLTVNSTEVLLAEGSARIGGATDFDIDIKLRNGASRFEGSIKWETGVRYDQDRSCLYLLSPEIQKLQIEGVPEKYTRAVSVSTKTILRKHLTEVPIYKIRDKTLKHRLARAVVKKVEVVDGKLAVTLGY